MSMVNRIMKGIEEFNKRVKENPRCAIESLADKEGNVRVFFDSVCYLKFKDGEETKGSTERFLPDDIVWKVSQDRIEKITDGFTILHIKGQ